MAHPGQSLLGFAWTECVLLGVNQAAAKPTGTTFKNHLSGWVSVGLCQETSRWHLDPLSSVFHESQLCELCPVVFSKPPLAASQPLPVRHWLKIQYFALALGCPDAGRSLRCVCVALALSACVKGPLDLASPAPRG